MKHIQRLVAILMEISYLYGSIASILKNTTSLYLKLGTTASATSFTVLIPHQGYYEMPANPDCYTGAIDGIWAAANGAVRITELT